jgi:alpha-1,2-mannosyltransferase
MTLARALNPPRELIRARPVTLVITITTIVALGLRIYYLTRPGFLLGVTEYDDGPYFASAVHLTQGSLPYRDFVLVQPPGITLLMAPAALAAKITGTAWAMAAGRVITALASTACVVLMGLLVRHRGVLVTLVACGVLAVFPDSVSAAHTILVEPWLVLFCLAGMVLTFDGDRLVSGRRLAIGGLAFGFAGAVEAWAIVPVLVLLALCLADRAPGGSPDPVPGGSRLARATPFAGGVAAGFCLPVLPFALAAPRGFYRSLVVAQVGPRTGSVRVPLPDRLVEMTGLSDIRFPMNLDLGFARFAVSLNALLWVAAVILVVLTVGVPILVNLVTSEPPTALEWFALVSTELVVAMLLWPSQFHYHFAAFLALFLALAIALPLPRVASSRRLGRAALGAAMAAIALFTVVQVRTESQLTPVVGPSAIAAVQRIVPPGACVISDNVGLLLLANRFTSDVPGCGVIDDGLGTDLALSDGLTPATGAARVPAVAQVWWRAFDHAQFAWLTEHSWRRIAWPPALLTYFQNDFKPILTDGFGDTLYRRTGSAP